MDEIKFWRVMILFVKYIMFVINVFTYKYVELNIVKKRWRYWNKHVLFFFPQYDCVPSYRKRPQFSRDGNFLWRGRDFCGIWYGGVMLKWNAYHSSWYIVFSPFNDKRKITTFSLHEQETSLKNTLRNFMYVCANCYHFKVHCPSLPLTNLDLKVGEIIVLDLC